MWRRKWRRKWPEVARFDGADGGAGNDAGGARDAPPVAERDDDADGARNDAADDAEAVTL